MSNLKIEKRWMLVYDEKKGKLKIECRLLGVHCTPNTEKTNKLRKKYIVIKYLVAHWSCSAFIWTLIKSIRLVSHFIFEFIIRNLIIKKKQTNVQYWASSSMRRITKITETTGWKKIKKFSKWKRFFNESTSFRGEQKMRHFNWNGRIEQLMINNWSIITMDWWALSIHTVINQASHG